MPVFLGPPSVASPSTGGISKRGFEVVNEASSEAVNDAVLRDGSRFGFRCVRATFEHRLG